MVHRPFSDLSKAAFITVCCAIVWPHLEYAMEANTPTLGVDINQLEWVQCLATQLVRGLRLVLYEERLRQLNLFSLEYRHFWAGLILAFKIFKGEIDLSPSDFVLRPLQTGLWGHIYRLLQGPSRLWWRSGAFSVRVVKYWNRLHAPIIMSPSVGPSMVWILSRSTRVISVPVHRHFSPSSL